MKSFLLALVTVVAMIAIVPLMIWGGSGSWRDALRALREYLMVLGIFAALGGGTALIAIAAEFIGR